MGPVDALNHLLNFVAPAAVVAALSAGFAKLLWRSALAPVGWPRLAGWALAASTCALIGGLVVFGQDGRMATYGAMLIANAAALWWAGFGATRR